jgi:cyclophilin family peptidyl-prolyl cis-trans isomerase
VNIVDNPDLDPLPTRWGYAVFGRVVQGMDVVDRIGATATGSFGPFKSDAPLKPVIIQKVEVIDAAAAAPSAPPAATPTAIPNADAILSPK